MKINVFCSVNENTDLAVSEDNKLLLVTKAGNQQTITTIGNMNSYTFNGMRVALDRLETFKEN